jgi:PAS domain S-box-containing protein
MSSPSDLSLSESGRSPRLRGTAYLLILLGVYTLVVSFPTVEILSRLDASSMPMHPWVGVGFLIWGIAELFLQAGCFQLTSLLSLSLSGLTFLTFLRQVGQIPFSVEDAVFPWFTPSDPIPAGGMPAELCITLAIATLSLIIRANRTFSGQRWVYPLSGLALVVCFGSMMIQSQMTSGLSAILHPPILGMIGCLVGAIGFTTETFFCETKPLRLRHSLPVGIMVVGFILTLSVWRTLERAQKQRTEGQLQFETDIILNEILTVLKGQVQELVTLAESWRGPDQPKNYSLDVFSNKQSGVLRVATIDGNLVQSPVRSELLEQRLSSNSVFDAYLTRRISANSLPEAIISGVKTGKRAVVLLPPESGMERSVLLYFAPFRNNDPSGGLIAYVFAAQAISAALSNPNSKGYAVRCADTSGAFFDRFGPESRPILDLLVKKNLDFEGMTWQLSVWPTQEVLNRENLTIPAIALGVGLLTSILLALSVHLALTAQLRTRELLQEAKERELTQAALTESESQYRSLIENLEQAIFLKDLSGKFLAVNQQFCNSLRKSASEIIGNTDADLYPPAKVVQFAEERARIVVEGKAIEIEQQETIEGSKRIVRIVLTPVRDSQQRINGVLGISWDVTQQRLMEDRLRQASKMDAVGQLAGGIAHDFNNLLTAILGNLDLLQGSLSTNDANRDLVAAAQNAATRAASLTSRLLGFSRQHSLDWLPTNLNQIIDEVVQLLSRTIDPRIRINVQKAPDLWQVLADPAQMNQILMNLCLNARDAMNQGPGVLQIETSCVRIAPPSGLDGKTSEPGDYVRLRISDNGMGMTPEVKARIYEPFFTTKEVGKGTGLGLPMVFAIVRQHHGFIDCTSEPGQGTCFDIFLPRTQTAAATIEKVKPAPELRTGKETILVADDEEMIRRFAVTVLKRRGYEVLEVCDGQEAVDVYTRERNRIDLVLLDLTMPKLSGQETFRQLLVLNPDVRVIFASGYSAEQLSDRERNLMAGFVKKPYRPNELTHAIQEAFGHLSDSRM